MNELSANNPHDGKIAAKGRIIMKDSKGLKNQNRKLEEQTPSPAVPNRAHTEMSTSEKRADNAQSKSSSKASDTLKKQSTK